MKTSIGLFILLLVVLTATIAQGDLKPVPATQGQAIMQQSLFAHQFTKPKEGDGTVSKKALVTKLRGKNIRVAIDSQSPDTEGFDVVRFDFSGKGKFNDKQVVPLKKREKGNPSRLNFGPATLQVERNGKSIPVMLSGHIYTSSDHKYIIAYLGTALEGTCKFGDKTYPVRIVDGNNNLNCGSKSRYQKNSGVTIGDTLLIDTGKGNFKQPNQLKKSLYGAPVLLDGVWYDVALSPDKSEIVATPSTAKTATLKIDHDNWSIGLIGKDYILMLDGSSKPMEIPAGKYTVMQFTQIQPTKGDVLSIDQQNLRQKTAKKFNAAAGKTFELAIGAPLTGQIKIKARGRRITMNFKLTDVSGMSAMVNSMYSSKPQVEVFDEQGKLVHTGKFEYG